MKRTIIALLALLLLTCCLTGCQKDNAVQDADNTAAADTVSALADYLADIKDQSDAIRTSLEQDALTQLDMNEKSQALCDLWEGALTKVLAEAQKLLPEAQLAQLTAEQTAWETDTAAAVEAAGKDYEGGTMHALVVNTEKARLTEVRVNKLYELLK